jgi:hypothetical protein
MGKKRKKKKVGGGGGKEIKFSSGSMRSKSLAREKAIFNAVMSKRKEINEPLILISTINQFGVQVLRGVSVTLCGYALSSISLNFHSRV